MTKEIRFKFHARTNQIKRERQAALKQARVAKEKAEKNKFKH